MNLFWREMKASRKSLIIWIIAIAAMVGGGMSKYGGLEGSGQTMNDLMADMPKAMKAIMGVGELDMATAGGYYGILFLYLIAMAAIHASMLGSNIVSKEERDKTTEFLLAKPISRSWMLTFKLLAASMNVVVINAAMLLSSFLFVTPYANGESVSREIGKLMLGMLFVQLLFLSVGAAIASVSKRPKRAVALSAGVMLATFLLSLAIEISGNIDYLSYATPFQYFDASGVIRYGIDFVYVILSVILILISLLAAYIRYNRRDLTI
ncbi:ABC transporter permease subunit [Paenibacillus sp. HB172176]|uniref:ABC transporter permease subunit n=1 Tax=Paenibacillus sp. HB172176 TaxID=2493690 RepID=UPI00143C9A62|nr:ABC transporter permease subunit [Paenibacillus sp. HB172176]